MCPDRELLSAWIDGEVPSPWRETIERHVAGCASCSGAVASVRHIRDILAADSDSIDASAPKARVEDRLSFATVRPSPRRGTLWTRNYSIPFPAAAAAALAFALLGFALVQSGRRNTELQMAMRRAFEATPVAASDMGIQSVIDYVSRQNAQVNINITLPAESFGAGAGEPVIVREAEFQAGSRR